MVPDAPNWLFSTLAFIGFVMCMIPLPWHLEAWNTGTCLYMIWTGLSCLIQFINSVVWNSDVLNKAPIWCDITAKFMIGASVAIPAASLLINRRLYQIASVQSVTKTQAQKRRDVMIDLAIGLGLPALVMILHVIVQGRRFAIYEAVGCYPFTYNTLPTFFIISSWPITIGLVSASYCIRTIRELAIRRAQFREFLSSNKNLSSSRYFRLMGLAGIEMLCTVPLGCYSIYINATVDSVQPYVSWDYAHANFYEVPQVPWVVWHQEQLQVLGIEMTRYFLVFAAVVFFAFFGFADEARKNYRLAYMSVAKRVGLSTGSISESGTWAANGSNSGMSYNGRSATMPVFITHQRERKRDSLTSFSSRMSAADFGGVLGNEKKDAFSPTVTSMASMSKESLPRSPVDVESLPLPSMPSDALDRSVPPQYVPDVPHAV